MKAHLNYYLLFLRTRTSRGTLKRTQDLGEKRHTLQPGTASKNRSIQFFSSCRCSLRGVWVFVEGRVSRVRCRGSDVECQMSRVEGKKSRVEGKKSRVEGKMSTVGGKKSRVKCRRSGVKSRGSKEKVEGCKYFKDSGFYSNLYFYYWQRLKMYFNFFIF